MLEMVHDRRATGVTRGFEQLLSCDVGTKWKNCHFITFIGWSLSKNRENARCFLWRLTESGSTIWHCLENAIWDRLWNCRKTHCGIN